MLAFTARGAVDLSYLSKCDLPLQALAALSAERGGRFFTVLSLQRDRQGDASSSHRRRRSQEVALHSEGSLTEWLLP